MAEVSKRSTKCLAALNDSTDDENCTIYASSSANKGKYKTEMCKNFSETGECPYRLKCRFAHGTHELSLNFLDQPGMYYRTRKCRSFWEKGVCPYGARCQFSHYQKSKRKERTLLPMLGKILNSGGEGEAQLPKILGSVSPGNHSQFLW